MASGQPRSILRPSVLQRLLGGDQAPERPTEDLRIGVRELRAEVMRDLEFLLNTRVGVRGLEGYPGLSASILAYGMPDLSRFSQSSEGDMQALTQLVADVIRRFEPRLDPKTVVAERALDEAEALGGGRRQDPIMEVRLRISAMLHVEPVREFVTFDTRIEMETGAVRVAEAAP